MKHLSHLILIIVLAVTMPALGENGGSPGAIAVPTAAPQPQDRRDSSGGAEAAGIAGAAIAGAACAALMAQAMREEDPERKRDLEMMAMMQCAQAAQSAASAAQNGKGKEKSTSPSVAAASVPSAGAPSRPAPVAPVADEPAPLFPEADTHDVTAVPVPEPAAEAVAPDAPTPAPVAPAEAPVSPEPSLVLAASAASSTTLDPIPERKVAYNDKGLSSGATSIPTAGSASWSADGAMATEAARAAEEAEAPAERRRRAARREGAEPQAVEAILAAGGEGKAPESKSGDGNSGFEQMLAQILGAPPAPDEGTFASGSQVAVLPGARAGDQDKSATIFEYASYRVRQDFRQKVLKRRKLAHADTRPVVVVR